MEVEEAAVVVVGAGAGDHLDLAGAAAEFGVDGGGDDAELLDLVGGGEDGGTDALIEALVLDIDAVESDIEGADAGAGEIVADDARLGESEAEGVAGGEGEVEDALSGDDSADAGVFIGEESLAGGDDFDLLGGVAERKLEVEGEAGADFNGDGVEDGGLEAWGCGAEGVGAGRE